MISHELTSGFDFWSRGDLRIDVAHLPSNFGAKIQSGVIDIFPNFKMAAVRHIGFVGAAIGQPTTAYS